MIMQLEPIPQSDSFEEIINQESPPYHQAKIQGYYAQPIWKAKINYSSAHCCKWYLILFLSPTTLPIKTMMRRGSELIRMFDGKNRMRKNWRIGEWSGDLILGGFEHQLSHRRSYSFCVWRHILDEVNWSSSELLEESFIYVRSCRGEWEKEWIWKRDESYFMIGLICFVFTFWFIFLSFIHLRSQVEVEIIISTPMSITVITSQIDG